MLFDKTINDYVERTEEKYRTQIDVSIAGTKVYGIYNGIICINIVHIMQNFVGYIL